MDEDTKDKMDSVRPGKKFSKMDEMDAKIIKDALAGVDITEIYSPERVAKICRSTSLCHRG